MKARSLAVGSVLCLAASSSFATVLALSSFATGTEDWLAKNGASDISWAANGGAPGAFVQAHDQSDGLWFFSAPAKFIVQASKAYGGNLAYELRIASSAAPIEGTYADVMLVAKDNSTLSYFGSFSPDSSWNLYTVPLTASASWVYGSGTQVSTADAQQMQFVLANLAAIRIRGDYRVKGEIAGLDTVTLVSAAPVPEPASAALGLCGGALLAGIALRRRAGSRWAR